MKANPLKSSLCLRRTLEQLHGLPSSSTLSHVQAKTEKPGPERRLQVEKWGKDQYFQKDRGSPLLKEGSWRRLASSCCKCAAAGGTWGSAVVLKLLQKNIMMYSLQQQPKADRPELQEGRPFTDGPGYRQDISLIPKDTLLSASLCYLPSDLGEFGSLLFTAELTLKEK